MSEVTLSLTKSEFLLVSMLVGDFYRALIQAGVNESSIGRQEVAALIDKLTEASHSVSGEK